MQGIKNGVNNQNLDSAEDDDPADDTVSAKILFSDDC